MESGKVFRNVFKFWAGTALVLLFFFAALLYIGTKGIPFVEGDHVVKSGEAYHFRIGMTRQNVFTTILKNYAKEGYYLRTFWSKSSPIANELVVFQNTKMKSYPVRETPVLDLKEISLPFIYSERWDIRMPSDWVNTIYLQFNDDSLVEIQKSRWRFVDR